MTNLARKYQQTRATVAVARPENRDDFQVSSALLSREVAVLGAILILLQIMDGVLTAIGVGHFGHASEANLAIRYLMESWGHIPALITVKSFAIVVVAVLCVLARHVSWIPRAMKGVIALYLGAAIIPWTGVIFLRVL